MNKISLLLGGCAAFLLMFTVGNTAYSQAKYSYKLTLQEVIDLAQDQSPNAIQAKHTFRSSYWEFVSYKANFLPSLVFSGETPSFSKRIENIKVTNADGTVSYVPSSEFSNTVYGKFSINQNVPFTGGTLSLNTDLQRVDRFSGSLKNRESTSYISTPISVTYRQSLFGVNTLKWDKKIEPIKYEAAKRTYLTDMEGVSIQAIRLFFNLASAQQDLETAKFNYHNNDTLYKISNGRYNIGTIGENDLLQSELSFMDAQSALNKAEYDLNSAKNRLRSFLGFNEQVDVEIIIPAEVPKVELSLGQVLTLAKENSPNVLAYRRRLIEAERAVAEARASRGFQADLELSFGLNQRSDSFSGAYKSPDDMETASIRLSIPILDWGRGKGRVKMAQSKQELEQAKVQQEEIDFEQDVILRVQQFNMQDMQFKIAAKADTVSQLRYDVTKKRYLIDKVTITDMNNAQSDRDRSTARYVTELHNYWNYYYTIRQLTLYDFIKDEALSVDFEELVR
ncbi:MAG: TolC family protein [Prevotellaceae bacterium]|jgi:outer membrane protein TolC|nr:TolC family protein [Prevotellaceae bacterium]